MYDNEEEIKKKRRNLLIVIGLVVVSILLLLILIISKSGSGKGGEVENKELGCTLEVSEGTMGSNGTYTSQVVVSFKEVQVVSEEYRVTGTIGTSDSPRNKETYTITKSGTYNLNGYVKDEMGNQGTCSLEVKVSLSEPSCELEIKKGTVGQNGWYTTDVEVGFKTMSSNSEATKIEKYYLEEEIVSLDDEEEVTRADNNNKASETLTVTKNQITTVKGYVVDSNGVIGSCSIKVMKDAAEPTCKLKVESGTPNSSGLYTDTPVVGFAEATDEVSDIAEQGIGIEQNYTEKTYAVTGEGTTKVIGYVKDKAGNEGTCSIEIKRPTTSTPPVQPTPPTPTTPDPPSGQKSYPSCQIALSGGYGLGNNNYVGTITASFTSKSSTNGATITQYGIGTSDSLNGKATYSVSSPGTYTIRGMVKDSYGNVGKCSKTFTLKAGDMLYNKVVVGDLVSYNAGVWSDGNGQVSTAPESFSGYRSGTSKNNGVKCDSSDTGAKHGWVVLAKTDGKVVLVHAGTPECFYHERSVAASTSIAKLNERAQGYKNPNYAESASMLSCSSTGITCNKGSYLSGIHKTGTHYYLATAGSASTLLTGVRYDGQVAEFSNRAYGVRPVIVLKANTLTTGKKDANGAWILTQ